MGKISLAIIEVKPVLQYAIIGQEVVIATTGYIDILVPIRIGIEDALARVEKAGGTVVKPIFAFPGGRRFQFADPDGYELAVWSDR